MSRSRSTGCCVLLAAFLGSIQGCADAAPVQGLSKTGAAAYAPSSTPPRYSAEEFDQRVEAHARFAAGLVYQMRGDDDRALEEFSRSALADPAHERLAVDLARRFIGRREPDRALKVLENTVNAGHAGPETRVLLGLTYVETGQSANAIHAFENVIESDPTVITAYHGLVRLHVQDGKGDLALAVLDRAAAQEIDDPRHLIGLVEQYEVVGRLLGRKVDEMKPRMLPLLNRALEADPAEPLLRQLLADRFKALGEFEKAAGLYVGLLQVDPGLDGVRQQLIDVYLRTGKRDLARQELAAVVRRHPTNARAHYLLGSLIQESGDTEGAARRFEEAILLDPKLQGAYYDLAGLFLSDGKPDEAIRVLDSARAHFKNTFLSEFYRGMAHLQKGDYPGSISHLIEAEVIGNTSEGTRLNHFFYFQLGAVHERNQQFEEAAEYFKKAIALEPDYAEALNYLGYMWADRGEHLEEAKGMIERALRLEPDSPAYLDSLAWVLFRIGDPETALPPMLKAIELTEDPDPVLFDHLGDIYASLKKMEKAAEAWRRALELKPDDLIRKKIDQATQKEESGP